MDPRMEELPIFCEKCIYSKMSFFLKDMRHCRQICKYNPLYQHVAPKSIFKRKWFFASGISKIKRYLPKTSPRR
jgi:hypothetical protein